VGKRAKKKIAAGTLLSKKNQGDRWVCDFDAHSKGEGRGRWHTGKQLKARKSREEKKASINDLKTVHEFASKKKTTKKNEQLTGRKTTTGEKGKDMQSVRVKRTRGKSMGKNGTCCKTVSNRETGGQRISIEYKLKKRRRLSLPLGGGYRWKDRKGWPATSRIERKGKTNP